MNQKKWSCIREKKNWKINCGKEDVLINRNKKNKKLNKISRKLYQIIEFHFVDFDSDDDDFTETEIDVYYEIKKLIAELNK